jgi:hypothetical protein
LATLETGNKYEKKLYLKSEEKQTVLRGFLQKAQKGHEENLSRIELYDRKFFKLKLNKLFFNRHSSRRLIFIIVFALRNQRERFFFVSRKI